MFLYHLIRVADGARVPSVVEKDPHAFLTFLTLICSSATRQIFPFDVLLALPLPLIETTNNP